MNYYKMDSILKDPDQHFIAVTSPTASEIPNLAKVRPLDDEEKTA